MENQLEDHILSLLKKQNKDYLSISQLRSRISASILKDFGLCKSSDQPEMLKVISQCLGKKLRKYKDSRRIYIGLNIPVEQMISDKLRQIGSMSSKQLGKYLPVSAKEYIPALNRLIASGAAVCSLNENHDVLIQLSQTMPQNEDREVFEAAYHHIGKGRGFVRIHQIREELGWSKERFDEVLKMLMADYTVELHGGDPTVLTKQQIQQSFTDENSTLYITLTWWGKRS